MDLVFQDINNTTVYCRTISNQSIELASALEKCYPFRGHSNGEHTKCIITSSGINAISVALQSLLIKHNGVPINIIKGSELYCDTPRLIRYFRTIFKFNEYTIDVNDSNKFLDLFDNQVKDQINILLLESASNPSGDIFDFELIKILRKKSKILYTIIDNTWLTHVIFNPFNYDADIVITSLTKYYSSGKCIAGAIICKKKLYGIMHNFIKINGMNVSPLHCQIVLDNINTIESRIIASSKTIISVTDFLKRNPQFEIRHSSITSDPSHIKALKFFNKNNGETIYPSVISIIIPLGLDDAVEWMKSTGIEYKTSYGSNKSRFNNWPNEIKENYTQCRLSIGYDDDYQMLIKKLEY